MRHCKKQKLLGRPVVGVAVDGASGYGRSVMRGAMQYVNAQRRWEIHSSFRRTFETNFLNWPQCQGAIMAGTGTEFAELILSRSEHVVSCSGSTDPAKATIVCLDDEAAGAMAARHLVECRLVNFAFYGHSHSPHSQARERGYKAALSEHDFSLTRCPVEYFGANVETKQHWPVLGEWLLALPKPVGILAVDDSAAIDLAALCRHVNLGVPEHVALIGVNNDDLVCDTAWSPISSVDAGFTRIGYAAAQVLERLIEGEKFGTKDRVVRLPPLQVVRRLSTDILAVDEPMLADAIRYIREHACDPCSVEDVLRRVPAGRRWLERQFESKLGRSPRVEILRVQLETAKRLLLRPGLILPDIAERCGFSGAPTLGRAFLRNVGTTPAAYRRTALRRAN